MGPEPPSESEVPPLVDTSVPLARDQLTLAAPLYQGDMSFGALSGTANIALARAADLTGTLTGTGEGGLHPEVAGCRRITVQWASARFGVDLGVLNTGQAIVIKIGQGAKPGIGGHLPGAKVTPPISATRRIPMGRDAISPAPHHDIYSIEDLGQRILALKEATGKPVFVKVGATNYIPYIASGVARMGGDGIILDASGAGTGAAPSIVKDNVGLPIELAVAAVHRALRHEGLRDGFSIIAAGRVSSPEDTAKLMALGADCVSLGTASLLALGCLMVHKCHLGFCPALLTNRIDEHPPKVLSLAKATEWIVNLIRGWTHELKLILAAVGLQSARELVGQRALLEGGEMHEETLRLLGLEGKTARTLAAGGSAEVLWSDTRRRNVQELAGTIGKAPGEAVVSSMGTVAPPYVDAPQTICDWLVSDGAQVTRPSIDPYREPIETSIFLGRGRVRLSAPFVLGPLRDGYTPALARVFARAALRMGLLFDDGRSSPDESTQPYRGRMLVEADTGPGSDVTSAGWVVTHRGDDDFVPRLRRVVGRVPGGFVLSRLPCTDESVGLAVEAVLAGATGVIVDGDLAVGDGHRVDLEVAVSEIDQGLASTATKGAPLRASAELLVGGARVRGADDIFKLIALGADAVSINAAALIAIGYEPTPAVRLEPEQLLGRLESFVLGLQRELRLLAGAAGVSSLRTSLPGNRELLRSVDLDPVLRRRLHVKAAGAS